MIEELYIAYKKDVYCYIYSLCKNQSLSEDLTSETFYQVIISLPSFQNKANIKTWIFSIARNVTFKELKKRKIEISLDDLPELKTKDKSNLAEEMKAIMKEQPVQYQRVFQLRLEGYSYEEIASALNINTNSARVIQHRNKLYLRQMIERGQTDEDKL